MSARYQGMPNGADPREYDPEDRPEGAVTYTLNRDHRCGRNSDDVGAYWDLSDGWCCCGCGGKFNLL